MGTELGKGHLDAPAGDKPHKDLARRNLGIRAEDSLRFEAFLGAADENPTVRDRVPSASILEAYAGRYLTFLVGAPIPGDGERSPVGGRVC